MHADISFCNCPHPEHMIFSPYATYYPRCKLLRVENQLFSLQSTRIGRHALQMLVHALSSSFSYTLVSGLYNRIYLGFLYRDSVTRSIGHSQFTCGVEYLHHGVMLVVHVRRVQRAARRYMRCKWEGRALAVMMASHARLGLGSTLKNLHLDALSTISVMTRVK
jgi:hypothetical protein